MKLSLKYCSFSINLKTIPFFTFVILILLPVSIKSQNYWTEIPSPTENFLHTQFFTDSLSGWIAGDSGVVFFTSDGGESWIQQQSNTSSNIQDIYFLDESRGWAIGWREGVTPSGTDIIKTTNGGVDWSLRAYAEDDVYLATINFLDTLNGWAGGYPDKLIRTIDGGHVWKDATIDSGAFKNFPVVQIKFYDSLFALACGGAIDFAGVIWRTTNAGDNWYSIGVAAEPIRDFEFLDSLNILGIGGDPEFFGVGKANSSDGGITWEYTNLGYFGVATALSFRTETECWAPLSFTQMMIYSTDSGNNWEIIPTPGDSKIYDLEFTDSLTAYGVGFNGKIIKYKKQNVTSIKTSENFEKQFVLYQNYPNPFNPSTKIRYHLSQQAFVSLKVYDVLGNEVASLVNETKPAGDYEVEFDIAELNKMNITSGISVKSGYTSGVYFYKLQTGEYTSTKKMILLK